MPLLTRRRTILAKLENTYGVDATPTGSANAILIRNLNVTPLNAEVASRDLVRPYLGNSEQLIASKHTFSLTSKSNWLVLALLELHLLTRRFLKLAALVKLTAFQTLSTHRSQLASIQ